jgi:hypothetical protein
MRGGCVGRWQWRIGWSMSHDITTDDLLRVVVINTDEGEFAGLVVGGS